MKIKYLVIILFALGIAIKLFGLNLALYDDEANYTFATYAANPINNPYYYTPFLIQLINLGFTSLLGLKVWVFRLVSLTISILTLGLIYRFTKKYYNQKTALMTLALMTFSFYFTLASLQIDVEGSLVTLLSSATIFSFLFYEKYKSKKWIVITTICLILALLAKYNTLILIPIIILYILIKNKKTIFSKNNIKKLITSIILFLIGTVVILFPYRKLILEHALQFLTGNFSLLSITMLLFWATPLLICPALLSLKNTKEEFKKDSIFYIWIIFTVLFYTTVIRWGDFSRYFINLIPPMAILSARYLSGFKLTKKQLTFGTILTILSLGFFFCLNSLQTKYIPRIMSYYLSEIKNLNFNFIFSYTSSSGPLFGINFLIVSIVLIITGLSTLYLLIKNNKLTKLALIILISVSLAFNIFLISEYIFHPTSPDVDQVQNEMIDYAKDNNLPFPIYSNNMGISWIFDNYNWAAAHDTNNLTKKTYDLPDLEMVNLSNEIKIIQEQKGTIIFLNWPPMPKESPIYSITSLCNMKKEFYNKNVLVGTIYSC